jgi:hypothetical protein
MSSDLSRLWDTLGGIINSITSWFSGVWGVAQNIINTGQGIFAGLVSFGAYLWDAVATGISIFGTAFVNAFQSIFGGVKYWVDGFGSWFSNAVAWIGSGLGNIGQQLFNFGQWIYNGLLYIWNWISNALSGVWESIASWFYGVSTSLGNWWSNIIVGVNIWFTNLLKGFRAKIVQTIMADLAIAGAWKAGERVLHSQKLSDLGFGLMGIVLSPFVGFLVGKIVDAVVPIPSTSIYPLIPDVSAFSYTPPGIVIEKPAEKPAPSMGTIPTPPVMGAGLPYDIALVLLKAPSYDYTTASKDAGLTMPSMGYDSTLEAIDASLMMPSLSLEAECLYEYYNTGDDAGSTIDATHIIAQTFTVGDASHYVTRLRLKLGKTWSGDSSPAKLRVSIRATQDGHPYGDDIVYVDVPHTAIPTVEGWVSIDIPPTLLNAGTKYAIVCRGIDVDEAHVFTWSKDSTSPTYTLGNEEVSTDGGQTWTSLDNDLMFEVYGY